MAAVAEDVAAALATADAGSSFEVQKLVLC